MKIFGFDYDGTLINIEPDKARALAFLMEKSWQIDKKKVYDLWFNFSGSGRRAIFNALYQHKFGQELSDSKYQKIEKIFGQTLKQKYYPKVKLLPYALDLLTFVRKNFDYIFVSSGVPHEEIQYLTKINGVYSYFDAVYGTGKRYKTKDDHFKEILQNRKADLKIFLADSPSDMIRAKNFNFILVGIPTTHSKEQLKNAGADYVCSLSEARAIIQKLLRDYI